MRNKYGANADSMMAKINEEADKYQEMGVFERMTIGGNNKKTRRRITRRRRTRRRTSTKSIRKTRIKKQKNRKSKKYKK